MNVYFTSLGCKLNQAEVDRFAEQFLDAGFGLAGSVDEADVHVVHTCTVTNVADKKSRQTIRQANRANPSARIIVSGCYAETSPGELAGLPEVDLVVGQRDKSKLVEIVQGLGLRPNPLVAGMVPHPSPYRPSRTRGFVKIQDGCNDFCSYCIIPYSRGRAQSVPADAVLDDVRRKISNGQREIVLTGVSIGAYGQDRGPRRAVMGLADLVDQILSKTSVERLRITSLEPHDFDAGLVSLFRDPRLCPHLHLCLQSGSDGVLRRMRRRYDRQEYAAIAAELRAAVPSFSITTDVIVGFPGETEAEFLESLEFVEQLRFADIHVFRYSPRAGTRAAQFAGQLDEGLKKARSEAMIALGERLAAEYRAGQVGARRQVLFESRVSAAEQGVWSGFAENYVRVLTPSEQPLEGLIRTVRVHGSGSGALHGELVEEAA